MAISILPVWKVLGVTRVSASKSIGLGHLIHNISTTVTFSFTKNVKKPDETYTNEYYIKN